MSREIVGSALRATYSEQITALWQRSREDIIRIGQALIDAKRELPHGQFLLMVRQELPFGYDTASRLMRVASDQRLSNVETLQTLPASTLAQDAIRRLPERTFERAVAAGQIHPDMTVRDARALLRQPQEIKPRTPDSLKNPILNRIDLLETMAGYRQADGISQLEADERAGMQEGYTGKLEIDVRAAVNDTWWLWQGARGLAMILVRKAETADATKCPCCGGPVYLRY